MALLQQIRRADQTGAAMEAQGFGTHQAAIRPGQGFLQNPAITRAAQLGRPALRRSKATIQAHRQDQAQLGGRHLAQPATRASRAAGTISSWGDSANTSAALLGLSWTRTLWSRAPVAAIGAVSKSAI